MTLTLMRIFVDNGMRRHPRENAAEQEGTEFHRHISELADNSGIQVLVEVICTTRNGRRIGSQANNRTGLSRLYAMDHRQASTLRPVQPRQRSLLLYPMTLATK
jgi:hypothetical protein